VTRRRSQSQYPPPDGQLFPAGRDSAIHASSIRETQWRGYSSSIAEAAVSQGFCWKRRRPGVAETTVKTHLYRVFSKTSRQADLVKIAAGFSNPLAS
jgi:hypothetical protein